jgi:hypothetical protein
MPVESFTSTVSSSHGVSDSPFIWGVRNLLRNPRPPYQGLLFGPLSGDLGNIWRPVSPVTSSLHTRRGVAACLVVRVRHCQRGLSDTRTGTLKGRLR